MLNPHGGGGRTHPVTAGREEEKGRREGKTGREEEGGKKSREEK